MNEEELNKFLLDSFKSMNVNNNLKWTETIWPNNDKIIKFLHVTHPYWYFWCHISYYKNSYVIYLLHDVNGRFDIKHKIESGDEYSKNMLLKFKQSVQNRINKMNNP